MKGNEATSRLDVCREGDILDSYAIFTKLYGFFGPQNWWPADSPFEVMVGAILTQNTSWKNVEEAIKRLKEENMLNPSNIYKVNISCLSEIIKPSGFYKLKARRLKNFIEFIFMDFGGEIKRLFSEEIGVLRKKLLLF